MARASGMVSGMPNSVSANFVRPVRWKYMLPLPCYIWPRLHVGRPNSLTSDSGVLSKPGPLELVLATKSVPLVLQIENTRESIRRNTASAQEASSGQCTGLDMLSCLHSGCLKGEASAEDLRERKPEP